MREVCTPECQSREVGMRPSPYSLLVKLVILVYPAILFIFGNAAAEAALSKLSSFKAGEVSETYLRGRLLQDPSNQDWRTDLQTDLVADRGRTPCYQNSHVPRASYLNLVIELRSDRSFKVIKAGQIAGQLILPDYPVSNFVYEVTNDHRTLVIGSFPDDPFTVRGLADRDKAKETSAEGKSATVVINVPLSEVTRDAIDKLHVRIVKLLLDTGTEVTSTVIKQLLEQKKALLLYDLPPSKLAPAIRKKLVRL
jgi:hypothetical protein